MCHNATRIFEFGTKWMDLPKRGIHLLGAFERRRRPRELANK